MYWWFGIWMATVAMVLVTAAISIFIQMLDWERESVFDWGKNAPQGWGPKTLYVFKVLQGTTRRLVSRLWISAINRLMRLGKPGTRKKKPSSAFYQSLYRAIPKRET